MPEVFRSAVFEIIAVGIAAAVLAMWGYIAQLWPLQSAILYGLVAFTCLVLLRDRFWQASDNIRVKSWLEATGFSVQTRSREDQNVNFSYVVTDPQGVRVNVYQPRNTHMVVMQVAMIMPPDVMGIFKALTPPARHRFISNVKHELLRIGIGFDNADTLEPLLLTNQIVITRDTSEIEFLRGVFDVRNAGKLYAVLTDELKP